MAAGQVPGRQPGGLVARDEQTGQPYLKLPMPKPDTLRKIADVLAAFANAP